MTAAQTDPDTQTAHHDGAGSHSDSPLYTHPPSTLPPLNELSIGAPLQWLASGWKDILYCRGQSLLYGVCYTLMALALGFVLDYAYQLATALTATFLVLGPFLALGIYDISRHHEHVGREGSPSLLVLRDYMGNIGLFAAVLCVIMLVWARASLVTFALFSNQEVPNLSGFVSQLQAPEYLEFLMAYSAVVLVFGSLVFSISVVSVPMMLDRNTDAISAMLISVGVVMRNPFTMLFWGLIIVSLTGLALASWYIGLVLAMPLIGHASWHAYRASVGPAPSSAETH